MLEFAQQALLIGVILLFLGLEIIVLLGLYLGRIDLTKLLAEKDGSASLSRFQFLIFTFVVASVFAIKAFAAPGGAWPTIPPEVLGLIGISGGSYVVSKGIQKNAETAESGKGNGEGDRWKR